MQAQWQAAGSAALVTGAASGIGLACARALASAGAKVALVDASAAAGEAAAAALRAQFGADRAVFVPGDVRSDADMEAAFEAAESRLGPLSAVLHAAGVFDDARWQREIDVNLAGTVRICLLARKRLAAAGPAGAVLCVASVAGLEAVPPMPIYSATKHGVVGLVRALGAMDRAGPRLMALCPGTTDTPLLQNCIDMDRDTARCFVDPAWKSAVGAVASTFEMMTYSAGCATGAMRFYVLRPAAVAASAMRALREGQPGSVWVSEGGRTYRARALPLREQAEPGSESSEPAL